MRPGIDDWINRQRESQRNAAAAGCAPAHVSAYSNWFSRRGVRLVRGFDDRQRVRERRRPNPAFTADHERLGRRRRFCDLASVDRAKGLSDAGRQLQAVSAATDALFPALRLHADAVFRFSFAAGSPSTARAKSAISDARCPMVASGSAPTMRDHCSNWCSATGWGIRRSRSSSSAKSPRAPRTGRRLRAKALSRIKAPRRKSVTLQAPRLPSAGVERAKS